LPARLATPIRLAIADDHPLFREGLISLLAENPDFTIVGAAQDGDEAFELVKRVQPDLLLLDLTMPRTPGLVALREVRDLHIATRTVLLTAAIEAPEIITALQLGARAIVMKQSTTDVLIECIHAVMQDRYWVGRKAVPDLAAALKEVSVSYAPQTRTHFGLTPREREIVAVIVDGCSNTEIATRFGISEKTVKHHLTNIFDKVGVSNRLELALFALHHRLVTSAAAEPERPDGRDTSGD
jgi:DNA-binding NarL/FixJ family response regulator